MKNSVYNCSLVKLPKIHNVQGNITALENNYSIPFEIKRVYYLYDIPSGEGRGGHAHKNLHQFVIAISGAFDILIDDGVSKKILHLDRPDIALHIVPGIWRELQNFSSCAICLVLASDVYSEDDYFRNYNDFLIFKKNSNNAD